jgi:hypothetical protein
LVTSCTLIIGAEWKSVRSGSVGADGGDNGGRHDSDDESDKVEAGEGTTSSTVTEYLEDKSGFESQ